MMYARPLSNQHHGIKAKYAPKGSGVHSKSKDKKNETKNLIKGLKQYLEKQGARLRLYTSTRSKMR